MLAFLSGCGRAFSGAGFCTGSARPGSVRYERRRACFWPLERHLPRVSVPLADDAPDVVLDLPAAFQRCWDEGPYPELLYYDREVPGQLTDAEQSWCKQRLSAAGFA